MAKLIIIRHGQSLWNKDNKFTGWIDIDLSAKGREEAIVAGQKLKNIHINVAFASELKRAYETLELILKEIGQENIPVFRDKALNERLYGDLQGMNKNVAREKFGAEQVHIWRRSWDTAPPNGESLKETSERVLPYYVSEIEPLLKEGKNVLISAHGNSLRALVKYLANMTPDEIMKTNIPTGTLKVYELDEELNVLKTYYLE